MQFESTYPKEIGLGDSNADIRVYIGNRPKMPEYAELTSLSAVNIQQINEISAQCGNGWRKVFNVFAKLLFELQPTSFTRWQAYGDWQSLRDHQLLRAHSQCALIFGLPDVDNQSNHGVDNPKAVHIICGRTHAQSLLSQVDMMWLNEEFAISKRHRLIICPYFDYRQLSNVKILFLAELIHSLS
ncbi:hypothetical protein QX776_13295 [Alteromonadaceae bacterium BrNp21-10]|nr:hypothetical protein [Alteromonadaceae bacterium BrNp21-10]